MLKLKCIKSRTLKSSCGVEFSITEGKVYCIDGIIPNTSDVILKDRRGFFKIPGVYDSQEYFGKTIEEIKDILNGTSNLG